LGNWWETVLAACYASEGEPTAPPRRGHPGPRRDPTHPVLVKVDEGLTVEVRAVEAAGEPKKTMGDLLREVGRWEGESGAELDALFTRQRGNRQVPELK
jgi:hypothetical protein